MTLFQFDAVDAFYDALVDDDALSLLENTSIMKEWDRDVLSSAQDKVKRRICISKDSQSEAWNNGGVTAQQTEQIKIELLIKTDETDESSYDMCEELRKAVKTCLAEVDFSGTGWINHNLIRAGYGVAPIKSNRPVAKAYYKFEYEVKSVIDTGG